MKFSIGQKCKSCSICGFVKLNKKIHACEASEVTEGGLVDGNGWGLARTEGLVSEEILAITLVS